MKPLLKWVGGKSQLLQEINDHMPLKFERFHEPFLGGGALFFHLERTGSSVSDFNPRLIDFYTEVRDHPTELFIELSRLRDEFDALTAPEQKAHYYRLRDEFNFDKKRTCRNAALFVYLNKAGFNGLFRENRAGEFNVPFGQKKSLSIPEKTHFNNASELLKSCKIQNGSFEIVAEEAQEGDFVYFDPPYVPLEGSSSFTSYLSSGFGPIEQQQLANLFRELSEKGVFVMASNSYTPAVRAMYDGFNVQIVNARRNINSVGSKRGQVEEALITNFER